MGHEHFLRDLETMRRRGASTLLVFENPRPEPEAVTLPLAGNLALVSARIADGRWCSFFVLDTTKVALGAWRADPGLVVKSGGTAAGPASPPGDGR